MEEPPEAGLREALAWLCFRRRRFTVQGRSMLPTLAPGDEVLCAPRRRPGIGDVVVAVHPREPSRYLIKRVEHIDEHGKLLLLGDNPTESTDSRTLGPFLSSQVHGPVTCRL